LGVHAELWKASNMTFCSETSYKILSSGTATPWGWKKPYTRGGNCLTGSLTNYTYASPVIQDWTTIRSHVSTP
jgi:hypothetical protein